MKIMHQISHVWNEAEVNFLAERGINVQQGHDVFQIEEGELYNSIKTSLNRWGVSDWVATIFDKNDIKKAEYLAVLPKWMNDYPQPEDDYLNISFDLSSYCSSCGIGKIQNQPLRIKREPNWGKKVVFSLNWIFDEIFIKKEYYDKILKPLGIECREVIIDKKNIASESTVQLKLPDIEVPLRNINDYSFEDCASCGRRKYLPITKGFFPTFESNLELPLFKTLEYFGSGAAADKRIIANATVKDQMINNKFNRFLSN